jgi:MraZ protein
MLKLYGGYECKLDNKGRALLPAKLKGALAGVAEKGFIIKRSVFSPCLELWPKDVWDEKLEEVNKLNRFVKKNAKFIRRFLAGVKTVELDSGGRLNLPNDLMAFAGITKSIVINSQLDVLEIWDKDRYEAEVNDEGDDDDFGDLAEEVMGDKPLQNQE